MCIVHSVCTLSQTSTMNTAHTRPQLPYSDLITQAILSSQSQKATLRDIYNFMIREYPYFREDQDGWKNSIRHNLSLSKRFVRVPRPDGEKGKGQYWMLSGDGVRKKQKRRPSSYMDTSLSNQSTDSTLLSLTDRSSFIHLSEEHGLDSEISMYISHPDLYYNAFFQFD
jgi:hypothetical protein